MKNTKTKLESQARIKILRGVNAIYYPIRLALGPASGRALIHGKYGRGPRITEDGDTIANSIEIKDEFEKLAADAFREATNKTNQKAGDGTTTTTVIAGSLINKIFLNLSKTSESLALDSNNSNTNVKKISQELLALSKEVQERIRSKAKKIESLEELEKIAIISMGDEKIGKIIANIVWEVGLDGFIDVVEGFKGEIETEIIRGARFPAKPGAKGFLNNPNKFEMIAKDAKVILTNYTLDNIGQIREVFGNLVKTNKKIVVIAPDFSQSVLTAFFNTNFTIGEDGSFTKTPYDIFPVRVPSLRTEQFEDLAVYFNAKFIDKNTGMKFENIVDTDLGFVEKLVVKDTENREDALAIGGGGSIEARMKVADKDYQISSKVAERIQVLKDQIAEERIESHKKLLERRIASLASAVGIIRVGASTSAESLPAKLKIEDAQYACKSALEEGYVRGGGLCLKEIADEMPTNLLTAALKSPYDQIQENNGEPFTIPDDVIDSAKVVRLAVEHAVAVVANMITVKILIPEEREMDPAEGYTKIAEAIMGYNKLFNKKEAIFKENELEMKLDQEASWDEIIKNE